MAVSPPPTWQELAEQLLDPSRFPDCELRQGVSGRVMSTNVQSADTSFEAVIVSLVTCTLGDRKERLVRLLNSLAQQTFGAFELIVVDQNPPGYLDEILQTYGAELCIKHVRSAPGLSVGRNLGLTVARGQIVGFPDEYTMTGSQMELFQYYGISGSGLVETARRLRANKSE